MPDSVAQIDRWRQVRSEDENIEFKEAKKQIHFDDVCRYCVAIANEGGGHFVLGMTNSPPRQVVGSAAIENPVKTANQIFQKLN